MYSLNLPALAPLAIVMVIVAFLVGFLPWFRIFRKAGYNPAMGCLMFIPLVNVVMMFVFAFSEWPLERELRTLKAHNPQN